MTGAPTARRWGAVDAEVVVGGEMFLSGVDLSVGPGSVTVVVGGDGAGKSTLCRLLVGILRPTEGRVDRPSSIGYQPGASGVWGDLTVAENLGFAALAHRLPAAARRKRVAELVSVTGLWDASDRLAVDLSGGMRQKLGVAMALVHRPEMVVLDEPTTGLDPVSRTEVWRLLTRAAADGAAVVTTTTYLEEAEHGSAVLVLDAGVPLAYGPLDEVMGSLTGALAVVGRSDPVEFRWRRGAAWRGWFPDGALPDGVEPLVPDLTDVVTVAAFSRRRDGR